MVVIAILRSTRGTAGSDIWYTFLAERPVGRSYHPRDYAWRPLKAESLLVNTTIFTHPLQRWFLSWRPCLRYGHHMPGALGLSIYWPLNLSYYRSIGYICLCSATEGCTNSVLRKVLGLPIRLQTTQVPAGVLYLVEQPPNCDLLRLSPWLEDLPDKYWFDLLIDFNPAE